MVIGRDMAVSSVDLVCSVVLDIDCEGLASPQEGCDLSCRCCVCIVEVEGGCSGLKAGSVSVSVWQ